MRGDGDVVLTDLKLAKEAIKGNEDAFLSLMLAHRDALFRTALAYLKNEEDALGRLSDHYCEKFMI